MNVQKIEQLDELLNDYLGNEKTVVDHETSRLTEIGENYGSIILALKIRLKSKDKTEILEAVAKMPPPGEFMQKMFNTPVTFRNEIDFYKIIVPELKEFLHEKSLDGYLDIFPEFFGSRASLQLDKTEIDDSAVILLENLKVSGYEMADRTIGFDLATSKIVIQAMARFHAVPLALKLQKPDAFQKIRSMFTPYKTFDFDQTMCDLIVEKTGKMVDGIDSCKQYVQNVVDVLKATKINMVKNAPDSIREPFATIIHTDAWVNNFMLRYHEDGTSCKIVDFQLDEYGSLARDLIFFLYSSVQIPVMKENYEELVGLYYRSLEEDLKKLGSEVPFSREDLEKEIEVVLKEFEFFHCMLMLEPMYATKDSLKELDQYNEEDMTMERPISAKHLERAGFIVEEFVKRKWI